MAHRTHSTDSARADRDKAMSNAHCWYDTTGSLHPCQTARELTELLHQAGLNVSYGGAELYLDDYDMALENYRMHIQKCTQEGTIMDYTGRLDQMLDKEMGPRSEYEAKLLEEIAELRAELELARHKPDAHQIAEALCKDFWIVNIENVSPTDAFFVVFYKRLAENVESLTNIIASIGIETEEVQA